MQPIFQLLVDGKDYTDTFGEDLQLLRITDNEGNESDSLYIELRDAEEYALPRHGAVMQPSLGFEYPDGKRELIRFGLFTVNEVSLLQGPNKMMIRANAADMSSEMRAKRTESFIEVGLFDVIATVANRYQLTPAVDNDLQQFGYHELHQNNESDSHFLTRLAEQHDAVYKVADGRLIFTRKGNGKSVSGAELPKVDIYPGDEEPGLEVNISDRENIGSIKARYWSVPLAEEQVVVVGDEEPVETLPRVYPNEQQAQAAAQAEMTRRNRGKATLNATFAMFKLLQAQAGGLLTANGYRTGIAGDWSIKNAVHEYSESGLKTKIKAEVPSIS